MKHESVEMAAFISLIGKFITTPVNTGQSNDVLYDTLISLC